VTRTRAPGVAALAMALSGVGACEWPQPRLASDQPRDEARPAAPLPAEPPRVRKAPVAADEAWAVRCVSLTGPRRHDAANSYAAGLRNVPQLNPDLVGVIETSDASVIYYGRYARRFKGDTPESFAPNPAGDLDLIRQLSMSVGGQVVWPFQLATLEALPSAQSDIARWELTRAPGYYSLQIGVFYNTEGMQQRRFAAEEACKLLRRQGEEAYYHHGPAMSIVCVGAFPKDAIQETRAADEFSGRLQFRSRIVDERMLALQRKHPFNLHNGAKFYDVTRNPRSGEKQREPHYSFPVTIPGRGTETGF